MSQSISSESGAALQSSLKKTESGKPLSIAKALMEQPRNPVSPLSNESGIYKTEYYRLAPTHQRFITILEQIAYLEGLGIPGTVYQGGGKGVRPLAVRIGVPQPSLRDYLNGNVSDPLGISSEYFEKVARARRISTHTLRCLIKGEEVMSTAEDLLASAWTADLKDLLPVLEVINQRMLARLGVYYQVPYSVYGVDLSTYIDKNEEFIRQLHRNLPIDLSQLTLSQLAEMGGIQTLELEQEDSAQPVVEPSPYEGNLRLLTKLQARLDELSTVGISVEQAMGLYGFTAEMMEEMEYSTEPVPDEWLAGPLMRALGISTEELLQIRDGIPQEPIQAEMDDTFPLVDDTSNPRGKGTTAKKRSGSVAADKSQVVQIKPRKKPGPKPKI